MPNQQLLLTKDEFFAKYDADPARRAHWESLALARAVAFAVERYRIEHKLSQRSLAAKLEMSPHQVARLELGERNPTIETLRRLAIELGTRFIIDIAPAGNPSKKLALPSGVEVVQDATDPDGSHVLVATG